MKLKRFLSLSLAGLIGLCVLVATDRRAYAYVEPGQGLLVLQTLASAAVAAVYFMRRRVRALFGGEKQDESLAVAAKASQVVEEGDSRKAA